jgi:hypothetical protein
MPNRPGDDAQRSVSRFGLGGVMIAMAFLALVMSIVSSAARRQDWGSVFLSLGVFSILAIPVLILGLVVRHSVSSRDDERDLVGLVVITLLVVILVCLSVFTNRL